METITSTSTHNRTFERDDEVVGLGFKALADERDALADLAWEQRTSRSTLLRRFLRAGLVQAGKLPASADAQDDGGADR
jgi:hypothetical protein